MTIKVPPHMGHILEISRREIPGPKKGTLYRAVRWYIDGRHYRVNLILEDEVYTMAKLFVEEVGSRYKDFEVRCEPEILEQGYDAIIEYLGLHARKHRLEHDNETT